jgi:excisionase family DNA binding protein
VLDLKGAAEFLKVSKPTFYRWLAQGTIQGAKVGQQWRFQRADLERSLQGSQAAPFQVDSGDLRAAVDADRKARKLPPIVWAAEDLTDEGSAVVQLVEAINAEAIAARASDIHLDAGREQVVVRYRIDGVLHEVLTFPSKASPAVIARYKVMADMDTSERRVPQDGRIHLMLDGREYDLRVATFPGVLGECLVARILDRSHVLVGEKGLERLGLSKAVKEAIEERLAQPQGLIIAAGPSGSGRTTTIYSLLLQLNDPKRKIVTIEDPVEYQIRGTLQMHVNRKAGLTAPVGLRYMTRSDPDIIMVHELRDLETAQGAIAAAMTGHVVLTTMIAPDSPAVITRLIEMGTEPFLVASALSAVIAQRLPRLVCQQCKAEYEPSPEVLRRLHADTAVEAGRTHFYRGKGCPQCRGTGYRGRTGLFELLVPDARLRELVARPASTGEIRDAAVAAGMVTQLQDGLQKAAAGLTTVEEVLRVLASGY